MLVLHVNKGNSTGRRADLQLVAEANQIQTDQASGMVLLENPTVPGIKKKYWKLMETANRLTAGFFAYVGHIEASLCWITS